MLFGIQVETLNVWKTRPLNETTLDLEEIHKAVIIRGTRLTHKAAVQTWTFNRSNRLNDSDQRCCQRIRVVQMI
jgi:hypothetical protein